MKIIESGMEFVTDNIFHIEKSSEYTNLGEGVKSVEFIRSVDNNLFFIEAKSSFPNPNNVTPNSDKEHKTGTELFNEAVSDICEKFMHSLNLYSAIDVGVVGSGFPEDYHPADNVKLSLFLIINGFDISWCDEIEKTLKEKMRKSLCIAKIWKPKFYVINDKIAAKRNLIVSQ